MPKTLKVIIFAILLLGLIALGLYSGIQYFLSPVAKEGAEQKFVVAKGQGIAAIGAKLQETGLIRSKEVFRLYVRLKRLDLKIQAGSFSLSPIESTPEITQSLTEGTEDVWITLLEGWRREEIAEYLESVELVEYGKADFLELTANSEGYLFPDTYLVPKEITTQALVNLFVGTFEKRITPLGEMSDKDMRRLVTLASLIEREARGGEQMKHVAGILENRLNQSMPLQVDATLQYLRGKVADKWWSPPRAEDKELKSPFNTYLNAGLPPHPIANPSFLALQAAFSPKKTDDLYYLHAPTGEIYYAQTYDEHLQNISKYLQ